ncbi:hypothetical protein EDC18_10790 [Natranaerovirga pectinivora]|uniref:6-hydroxymethylpterin diphosphokinase MptE-like domain-containing protein n=1 Tax=Natranaerovirga pectinivora TaxID=682400 RepID=A0A4V2V049_9FIRM|nr:6-hydroxymethylpterin diphosphokinase MptE-like protein [Natranaerovirga pectinivora]TCT14021.1 hypothetical protein EDC18_10790 [Natranaerovirga pectinivora]
MIENNNSIYTMNINGLRKKYPDFLDDFKQRLKVKYNIEVINSRDNNYSMVYTEENISMYLHSKYRPTEEAEKWVNSQCFDNNNLVIFGFGLSYNIREIIKIMTNKQSLIIIEPSIQVFHRTIQYIDCVDIFTNDKVHIIIGTKAEKWHQLLSNVLGYPIDKDMSIYALPNYDRIFENEYNHLKSILEKVCLEKDLAKNTILNFSNCWQKNLFNNLPYILTSHHVKYFFGKFRDKPAFIVSAGPSLDKNIKHLKEAKGKAIIISVDTALPVLLRNGIKPDVAITVDGGYANFSHFKDIDYSAVPIIYDARAYYGILEKHTGKKILSMPLDGYVNDLFNEWKIEVGNLLGDHTVASNAFEFAIKVEANPIVFIGQDLSYKDYSQTHALGAVQSIKTNDENEIVIKDINGNDVLTNATFYASLIWFNKRIALDKSLRVYIDATEGGAKIEGTKIMTLKDTIDLYCKHNIDTESIINEVFKKRSPLQIEKIEVLIKDLKQILITLKRLKSDCEEAEVLCQSLYELYYKNKLNKTTKINTIIGKLNNIDKKITSEKDKFSIINLVLQPVLFKSLEQNSNIEKPNCSEREKGIKISLASKELYLGIVKAIDDTEFLLMNCIKELEEIFTIEALEFTVNIIANNS